LLKIIYSATITELINVKNNNYKKIEIMEVTRYIITLAVLNDEKKLIPFWDDKCIYKKGQYGEVVSLSDSSFNETYSFVECVYDLKKKQLEMGIELNHYPSEKDIPFKINESVFVEQQHRHIVEAKVVEIIYEDFSVEIKRGKKLDDWWIKRFKDVNFEPNLIYVIKIWKPYFLLDNGDVIKYEHELFHKAKESDKAVKNDK
jgi:hypothetical protein